MVMVSPSVTLTTLPDQDVLGRDGTGKLPYGTTGRKVSLCLQIDAT
jgi:hypothetical protein